MTVELRGLKEVRTLLLRLPKHLYDGARDEIKTTVFRTHATITKRLIGGPLHSRTGALRRSLTTQVKGNTLSTLSGRVETDSLYAPIQEHGGIVKAKKAYKGVPGGPYLNIPLSPNKTSAGVMRRNPREVFGSGGYIIRTRRGRFLVMDKAGTPMFVLRKKVKIPARLGMVKAGLDEVPGLLARLGSLHLE